MITPNKHRHMNRKTLLVLLLATTVLASCVDNQDNPGGGPQLAPVDEGPAYTDKTVDVNRDGKSTDKYHSAITAICPAWLISP